MKRSCEITPDERVTQKTLRPIVLTSELLLSNLRLCLGDCFGFAEPNSAPSNGK